MKPGKVVSKIAREGISVAGKLRKIGVQKELWYKKAIGLKRTMHSLISKIKILKTKKDVSNVKVKEYKNERDKYNKKVSELIRQVKKLNEEKRELIKKYGIKFDPISLKESMERLEMKIETEALKFDKEKKLMGEIKRLKKLYDESGVVTEVVDKINNISKEIDEAKTKAEEHHKKLREHFKESKNYKEFIELSKQIDEIKKQQESAFNTFWLLKKEYEDLNKRVTNSKVKKLRIQEIKIKNKEKIEKEKIEEKAKEVEKKLKTEKKLTTEDLIAYQGKNGSN